MDKLVDDVQFLGRQSEGISGEPELCVGHMSVVLALGKQRQEDQEIKASLSCMYSKSPKSNWTDPLTNISSDRSAPTPLFSLKKLSFS